MDNKKTFDDYTDLKYVPKKLDADAAAPLKADASPRKTHGKFPAAKETNELLPKHVVVPSILIVSIGLLAVMIPAVDTYLAGLAGIVIALVVVAYTNNAFKYRLKRIMGSHEGQARIQLAANTTAIVNIDMTVAGFNHWEDVYIIDKSAVRDEGGIPTLHYYQGISAPIVFPDLYVIHSADKISAAQKTHWTITRMLAANELWDLFKLIAIGIVILILIGLGSAYLGYDASQKADAAGAYCNYVMNQTLEVANRTAVSAVIPHALT